MSYDTLISPTRTPTENTMKYSNQPDDPYTGSFNTPKPGYKTGSEIAVESWHIWLWLKTAVLGYQAGKDASNRGASTEEAVVAGATAALGFQLMIGMTFVYLIELSSVIAQGILFYDPISTPVRTVSAGHFWLVYGPTAAFAVLLLTSIWLALFSRLKNKLASTSKRGKMYWTGYHINRRFFRNFRWWTLGLLTVVAPIPMGFFLSITL